MKKHAKFYEYLWIIIGTGILAFGIACFYDPIGLVTGGVTGLAIVIKSVTSGMIEGGVPLWLTNALFNVPMFIMAYFLKGKAFIGKSFFGAMMLSAWLAIIPQVNLAGDDMLLSAVFGAVFCGAGIGLVFKTVFFKTVKNLPRVVARNTLVDELRHVLEVVGNKL